MKETLIQRFCQRYSCPKEGAERRLLLLCIPLWKQPLWHLAARLSPQAFERDWEAILEASHATAFKEVVTVVESLHYRGRTNPNFWRRQLALRISGRRLQEIAKQCFEMKR